MQLKMCLEAVPSCQRVFAHVTHALHSPPTRRLIKFLRKVLHSVACCTIQASPHQMLDDSMLSLADCAGSEQHGVELQQAWPSAQPIA